MEGQCHLLAYPTFIPTTLTGSYVGVRAGGMVQWDDQSPFLPLGEDSLYANGTGALDFSRSLLSDHLAILGSLTGNIGTGLNVSTLLGAGSNLDGGLDLGFILSQRVVGAGRVALTGRVMERYGTSLLAERAFLELQQYPMEQTAQDAAGMAGAASKRIAVGYYQNGVRLDGSWLWVALPYLSFQGVVGVERVRRYYRNTRALADAAVIRRWVLPRLGVAAEFDVSWFRSANGEGFPPAVLLEYQLSPTQLQIGTMDPATTGPAQKRRMVEHVAALGLHYSDITHPNIDAALTVFGHLNAPFDTSSSTSRGGSSPTWRGFGGQVSARYIW